MEWVWPNDDGLDEKRSKIKLQVAIKRLNDDLAELTGLAGQRVVRADFGYRLVVEPDELDVFDFDMWRRKAAESLRAGQPDRAVRFAREALALWRGLMFGELAHEVFAVRAAKALEDRRLATQQILVEALLRTGSCEDAASVAAALVELRPSNEEWRKLLTLALYRSGHHADALATWRDYLARLAERGLELAEDAKWIETAILNRDARLLEGGPEAHPPTGPKTYLFTASEAGPVGTSSVPDHAAVRAYELEVEAVIDEHRGFVFDRAGLGFCTMFEDPTQAVLAACDIGRALQRAAATTGGLRITVALHTGTPRLPGPTSDDPQIVHVARLRDTCHPGQVLVSTATRELVIDELPLGVILRSVGHWQFDASARAELVYQLVHEDLPGEFPPLRTGSQRAGRPLTYTSAFVGREKEQADIARRLQPGTVVTLVGPGGVGKTRLAMEVAHRVTAAECPDEVWFCDVSHAEDAETLVGCIAAALGLVLTGGGSHRFEVVQRLATAQLLLILDGCEHVRDEVAALVAEVLTTGGSSRLLVTSRARLGIPGEQAVDLAPLAVPAAGDPEPAKAPAVLLLVVRGRSAGAAVDPADGHVVELARRLDGLPLAIELAAKQLNAFPASKLVERFDDDFATLSGGTLQATFEGSFALVSQAGRRLLTALSVFRGTWSLEGAEAVASAVDVDPERVMALTAELVGLSLVRLDMPGSGTARYRMLDTIRAYAAEHLASSGRGGAVAALHAVYFLDLAERAASHRRGPDEPAWVEELVAEFDNLRAAYRAFVDGDRALDGLRLATALAHDLILRERLEVGRWGADLAALPAVAKAPERVHALGLAANAAMVEDRLPEAADLAWEAVRIEAATPDAPSAWLARNVLAMTTLALPAPTTTPGHMWIDHIHAMEAIAETLDDPFPRALALWNRAFLAWWSGDHQRQESNAQQLVDLGSRHRNSSTRSMGLLMLGRAAVLRRDADRARDVFQQALGAAEMSRTTLVVNLAARALADLGDHHAALVTLRGLASSFLESGNQAELAQTALSIVEHLVALRRLAPAATALVCLQDSLVATRPGFDELHRRVLADLDQAEHDTVLHDGQAMSRSDMVAELVRVVGELSSEDDDEEDATR
jgi:predicted ATPase/DNA-binding SARP family transcriptional activator